MRSASRTGIVREAEDERARRPSVRVSRVRTQRARSTTRSDCRAIGRTTQIARNAHSPSFASLTVRDRIVRRHDVDARAFVRRSREELVDATRELARSAPVKAVLDPDAHRRRRTSMHFLPSMNVGPVDLVDSNRRRTANQQLLALGIRLRRVLFHRRSSGRISMQIHYICAIEAYQARERRFGLVPGAPSPRSTEQSTVDESSGRVGARDMTEAIEQPPDQESACPEPTLRVVTVVPLIPIILWMMFAGPSMDVAFVRACWRSRSAATS